MICSSPLQLKPKGVDGKRYVDVKAMTVPCGQCRACRINKGREWPVRIKDEEKKHSRNAWICLTYRDDDLPLYGSLDKTHTQLYLKKLRKRVGSFRFFEVGEYGERFGRPHYHLILFGVDSNNPAIKECWRYGDRVDSQDVHAGCGLYAALYSLKKLTGKASIEYTERGLLSPYLKMSRRPGIGLDKDDIKSYDNYARLGYARVNGKKTAIPRYYKLRDERLQSNDEFVTPADFSGLQQEKNLKTKMLGSKR